MKNHHTKMICIVKRILKNAWLVWGLITTPPKYIKNWKSLYLYSILAKRGEFTARDGTKSGTLSARSLLRLIVVIEFMFRETRIIKSKRCVSFSDKWVIIPVLNDSYKMKVHAERIIIASIPDLFTRLYDIEVKDRTVLDIGAYIGDSVLYWLHKGAKKVIAVEPVPEHYEVLLENVKELPVITINASIGAPIMRIENQVGWDTYGLHTPERGAKQHSGIPVYGLAELVERWRPDVVKLNCEGCEYDVLSELTLLPILGVKAIIVQLHDKPPHSKDRALAFLQERLGKCRITEIIYCKNPRITCIWELS